MLWYKTWHESKTSFLYVMAGMLALSAFFAFSYEAWLPRGSQIGYETFLLEGFYRRFYHAAWVFSTLFLAAGGLLSERRSGAVLFTLSLPVARGSLLLTRAGMGAAQAFAAAMAPSMALSGFAFLAGRSFPFAQTIVPALLLAAGGTVFFCLGFALSATVGGDWAPAAIGVPLIAGIYTWTRSDPDLRPFNPQDLFGSVQASTPWAAIGVSQGIGAALVLLALLATRKRDF